MRRGLSVSEYGITEVETGEVHAFATEEEVYALPRLRVDPAGAARERRRARGRAHAASCRRSSSSRDLRGDLHTHTTWSDGKDSLEAMVARAVEKGYEYYAICDHSHRLRDGRLEQQAEAIDALNARVPIRLLKGIEVNIRADGELDVADEDLATLDWVVASVHNELRQGPDRARPRGDGEPVRRLHRPPDRAARSASATRRGIDVERVIEKALETGTFLEINSQPDRLDLTDVHARAAREAGLKLVIDSDGHQLSALDYVELGVGQARRAWLTKDDVVNTRTWKQIERLRKRAR